MGEEGIEGFSSLRTLMLEGEALPPGVAEETRSKLDCRLDHVRTNGDHYLVNDRRDSRGSDFSRQAGGEH